MPLRSYQVAAIKKALPVLKDTGGFYVQHAPGMGKTLTGLSLSRLLGVSTNVVICPSSAVGVWCREIRQWLGPDISITIIEGEEIPPRSHKKEGFYIASWGAVRGDGRGYQRRHFLELVRPDLLIADEVHHAKSWSSGNNQALRHLRAKSGSALFLSGTPAHSVEDYWAQYRLLARQTHPWNKTLGEYRDWVGVWDRNHVYLESYRPAEVAEAMDSMLRLTHVATTAETDWPAPVESIVTVKLSPREQKAYDELEATRWTEVDGQDISAELAMTKVLRLSQLTGGWVTSKAGTAVKVGSSKLDALVELLEDRPTSNILVAATFTAEIQEMQQRLSKLKTHRVLTIQGGLTWQQKTHIEDTFQRATHPTVLILQYRAGGEAMTLTSASTLIRYSIHPSVIAFTQMNGRAWREGQTKHVEFISLLAEGTLDSEVLQGVRSGLDMVSLARHIEMRRQQQTSVTH